MGLSSFYMQQEDKVYLHKRLVQHVIIGILVVYMLYRGLHEDTHYADETKVMQISGLEHKKCEKLSTLEKAELLEEVSYYEKDAKFARKIGEAKGEFELDTRGLSCVKFLEEKVLASGQSVLDLGSAAGAILCRVSAVLQVIGGHGRMVGVELVGGWVKAAKEIFGNKMEFYHADITEFDEIVYKFDVIMMNDVVEHVQPERYGCLYNTLKEYSRPGTAVYMHIPSPEAQLKDEGQFFENVVPHHALVSGMAGSGFELEHFSYDYDTDCQSNGEVEDANTRNRGAKCIMNGAPKYTHFLFRRVSNPEVLILHRKTNEKSG